MKKGPDRPRLLPVYALTTDEKGSRQAPTSSRQRVAKLARSTFIYSILIHLDYRLLLRNHVYTANIINACAFKAPSMYLQLKLYECVT